MGQGSQAGKPADLAKRANDLRDRAGGTLSPEIQRARGMRKNPVWKPPQNSQPDERSGIFFILYNYTFYIYNYTFFYFLLTLSSPCLRVCGPAGRACFDFVTIL